MDFANIPSSLRIPFVAIEFDASRAGSGAAEAHRVLIIGQRSAAAPIVAGIARRIASIADAEASYGRSSMLAEMFRYAKAANRYVDTWAIALDDAVAGVAATGTLTFTGPATAAGTLALMLAGHVVRVGVTSGMTAAALATAVAAAINADTTLPITAAAVDGVVTLTCRWKGLTGNDLDLRVNYYDGEALPAGITLAIVAMSGGTTNPDISAAIAALGDTVWDSIVMPYTDAANMTLLEAELASRWIALSVKAGVAWAAYRGTHGATGTFGGTRNSGLVTCIGTNLSPEPPYCWAAVNAVIGDAALSLDPARQLKTLVLTGLKPPSESARWDDAERNLLLLDGIATYVVDSGGLVRIERQITMYQTNAAGVADDALLDVTTPYTWIAIAREIASYFPSKYPRHKLADDGTSFAEGAAIVTPLVLTADLLMLARGWESKGWAENLDQFKTDLRVERDAVNRNRVNTIVPPDLVNNFMQLAVLLQPRQ